MHIVILYQHLLSWDNTCVVLGQHDNGTQTLERIVGDTMIHFFMYHIYLASLHQHDNAYYFASMMYIFLID